MNKSELIASIAEKSNLSKKDAENALNGFLSTIEEALSIPIADTNIPICSPLKFTISRKMLPVFS